MSYSPHVAIAGATGAVGEEMLKCLEQRNFPVGEISLLASARSAGRKILFRGEECVVQELGHDSFKDVDIALFSAGGALSLEYGPSAAKAGAPARRTPKADEQKVLRPLASRKELPRRQGPNKRSAPTTTVPPAEAGGGNKQPPTMSEHKER